MGLSLSKLISGLFGGSRDMSIVMVGLDAAGKTTILYKLKLGEITSTIPTIGFNVESVEYKNTKFNVWDIGGQQKIRHLWRHYYKNVDGVIFVVDSSDAERFAEAKGELEHMMAEEELSDAVALILANKQDLPNATDVNALTEKLGLYDLKQKWYIQPCCAVSGDGLYEGLDWLSSNIQES